MAAHDPAPHRILVADDQADVLEALRLLLKAEGYLIETVKSPAAVLKAIEARDFAGLEEDGSRKQQLQHLVLTAGILQETQWIAFSEKALAVLGEAGDCAAAES